MNVLFIAHEFHGRCHQFMLNALRRQASYVDFHLTHSALMTPALFARRTAKKIMRTVSPSLAHASTDRWRMELNRSVCMIPNLEQYDLILFSEHGNITADTYTELRRRSGATLVAWLGDSISHTSPSMGPYMKDHIEHMDLLFFPDQQWCREAGPKASFLPYGADFDTYADHVLPSEELSALRAQIAHVGILTPARVEALEATRQSGFDVGIWGASAYKWSRSFSRSIPATLRDTIRSGAISPEDAGRVYNAADIVLNVHSPQFTREGINNRTFEVGACNAFQLLNFKPNLPSHDEGIDALVSYAGSSDLVDKTRYFIQHESERWERAAAFAKIVRQYHTYDNRILDILNHVDMLT